LLQKLIGIILHPRFVVTECCFESATVVGDTLCSSHMPWALNPRSQALRRLECSFLSRIICKDTRGCRILYHGPFVQTDLDP
jgi:hypothetical protein